MSVTSLLTKDYTDRSNPTVDENKPNSNPIQTQTNPIAERPKINANSILTKDYEDISACEAAKNKPKTNPIKLSLAQLALSAVERVEWSQLAKS